MKNLQQLLTAIFFLFLTHQISAQSLVVKGGFNLSNFSLTYDNESFDDDYKMNPGFNVGAYVELPLYKMFTLETGLVINTKGHRIKETNSIDQITGSSNDYEFKINLLYLDIPLVTKASFNVGKAKIYGSFGPYVGMGLSGKTHFERKAINGSIVSDNGQILTVSQPGINQHETVKWGLESEDLPLIQEEEYRMRRLDYGLIFGAGVEIKSIQLGVSYGLGLANISPSRSGDWKQRNQVLSVSLGYRLLSKK